MSNPADPDSPSRYAWRRWVAFVVFAVFFGGILWTVVNPYRDQPYAEVPHGDHVHYVPKDREREAPIGQFPTRPPEPGERITPNGRIVPEEDQGAE